MSTEVDEALQARLDASRFRLGMLLRQSGVGDAKVLATIIDQVPREQFVNRAFVDQSYDNVALPAGEGQTISAPEIVWQMTSALDVQSDHRVLEIGTGSGYQAAILSQLAKAVFTIERFERLALSAKERLASLGIRNVQQFVGDGTHGLSHQAPFDRIMLTAAPEVIPAGLFDQLKVGGVLVAPVGKQGEAQHLVRCIKTDQEIATDVLGKVKFVPLVATMPQA